MQEVYLQAWKSFDRFETGTNCRAWLFKILFNTLHHYRRKWFNLRIVKESEEVIEQATAYAPPVERITDDEILAALAAVDLVVPFDQDTPRELILACMPDILVKGGDYDVHTTVGAADVIAAGGRFVAVPFRYDRSTTALIGKARGT